MEKNITAKLVREQVMKNPLLTDQLARDLINSTNLARELLPGIKEKNPKATVESISIAIRRLPIKQGTISNEVKDIIKNLQITMRTNVNLICLCKGSKLPETNEFSSDDIFYVNQGSDEITIIVDEKNEKKILGEKLLHKKNLAVLSLKDTLVKERVNYRNTPGIISLFLSNISKEGINVVDIISTFSQITFVIEEEDLEKVYKICSEVKKLEII